MNTVITKNYTSPPFCRKEALRYSQIKNNDAELLKLFEECVRETKDKFTYKICYKTLPIKIFENICDFNLFSVKSKDLSVNLKNCNSVLIFSATVGTEIDRLIIKYSQLSPTKALIMQGLGTERIESLCNLFCEDFANQNGVTLKPRFSPGYGDLPVKIQKELFSILGCTKNIGVSLTNSFLMTPSKSVTAFVGIENKGEIYEF